MKFNKFLFKNSEKHLPKNGPVGPNGKEILVSLKNVDITFGKGDRAVRAVKNASFDIYRGETFSLVGESGSGKTTIGRAVIRVNPCANGQIDYKGVKISGDIPKRCRELLDYFKGELKCVFDMGNFVLEGVSVYPSAYELLKKDIAYFHIKDAFSSGAIVPPGKGDAKIPEILSAHKAYAKEDFFVSLEPHLLLLSNLNSLVGRAFDNPYKYADSKVAFSDAVAKIKEII